MTQLSAAELEIVARATRSFCKATNKHVGSSLSISDALSVVFHETTLIWGSDVQNRDRLVYSKGHAAAPFYFNLWLAGLLGDLSLEQLLDFGSTGNPLTRMPRRAPVNGIEMSAGSLGQGLSFACGLAIATKKHGWDNRVFAVLGDGECTEGQVWEAAATAARTGLDNLVLLVDANGLGSHVPVPRSQWRAKFDSFGFDTVELDGHDLPAISTSLSQSSRQSVPRAVILHTRKGNGLTLGWEGSDRLSGEVPPEALGNFDLPGDVAAAQQVVLRLPAPSMDKTPQQAAPPTSVARPVERSPHQVGSIQNCKKIWSDVVGAYDRSTMLAVSTDAIRNSGLSHLMDVGGGSWHSSVPQSPVWEALIAEQDAASVCAGLVAGGVRAALFSMEGFYWRMLDQIRQSILFPDLPVIMVGTSGGVGDPLGAMVQSDSLIAALGSMPGLQMYEASDANLAAAIFNHIVEEGRPAYLRIPHEDLPVRYAHSQLSDSIVAEGWWDPVPNDAPEVVVVSSGSMTDGSVRALDYLDGSDLAGKIRVVDLCSSTAFSRVPPEKRHAILRGRRGTVSVINGPASARVDVLKDVRRVDLAVQNWGFSGTPIESLYRQAGLSPLHIARAILDLTDTPSD